MNAFFRTAVGPRGRVTLSSAVRAEAGIAEGDVVVVSVEGPGVVAVRTMQAIKDSIRAGNPDGKAEEQGEDQNAPEQ